MRPEGRMRAGFFPTPKETLRRLGRLLHVHEGVTMLDPAAGEGDALAALGDATSVRWGVEVNQKRAGKAAQRLDHVIVGDALDCNYLGGCDCLFLNAPFERGKLELKFLEHYTPALAPGGVLVHILSEPYLTDHWPFLWSHYENLKVYRFPGEEYEAFAQVVVVGRARQYPVEGEPTGVGDIEALPEYPPSVRVLRRGKNFELYLHSRSEHDIDALVSEAGVNERLTRRFEARDVANMRPLMPLEDGHVAQLFAMGLFDNAVIRKGDTQLLVRGRAYKDEVTSTDTNTSTTRVREVIRTQVLALDLATAELITIT